MRQLITRLLATLGAFASAIALVVSTRSPIEGLGAWHIALLTSFVIFGVTSLALEVAEFRAGRVRTIRSNRKTKEYMFHWLSQGGTAAIFTRSLGWASEDGRIAQLLRLRAGDDALTIVMPRATELSEELRRLGADVYYYPKIDYVIRTRFTLLDVDRADTRVAVGRVIGQDLVIQEYADGVELSLARDLFELVRRMIRANEEAKDA